MAAMAYNSYSSKPNQLIEYYRCTDCDEIKHKSKFPKDNRKVSGVSSICKKCHAILTSINRDLERANLVKNKETINYLLLKRLLYLKERNLISAEGTRSIQDRPDAIKCAYSIRSKGE